MLFLQAILLGVVEGLTEFIPVSSTGHLILLVDLLDFQGPKGKVFEIVVQLGAILAICWVYRHTLWRVVTTAHTSAESRHFIRNVTIAFIPAAVLGATGHGFIKEMLFSPWVVSVMLILGGIIILLIERRVHVPRYHHTEDFTPKLALSIGLCQVLAMIPGTSRSGATIMGALLLGVDRKAATEFSFFLAIPTMLGATAYDIYMNWEYLDSDGAGVIAVGFLSAFIAAMLVVRTVIRFISQHGFTPFAWYRIVIGGIMLSLLLMQN